MPVDNASATKRNQLMSNVSGKDAKLESELPRGSGE